MGEKPYVSSLSFFDTARVVVKRDDDNECLHIILDAGDEDDHSWRQLHLTVFTSQMVGPPKLFVHGVEIGGDWGETPVKPESETAS